ncbi:MAG TPA: DUF1257 domain-containing protein [Verrucomicrobiota bacterium]|nr:DUF1257 domain-containing protein [Verrucomicrobiota bacterium]
MSHIVQVKTKIKEQEVLIEALKELNLSFQTGENLFVLDMEKRRYKVDILITTDLPYNIGFVKTDDGFDIVGDLWAINAYHKIKAEDLIQKITNRYAYVVIKDQLRNQNMVIENEEVMENGDIVITASEKA